MFQPAENWKVTVGTMCSLSWFKIGASYQKSRGLEKCNLRLLTSSRRMPRTAELPLDLNTILWGDAIVSAKSRGYFEPISSTLTSDAIRHNFATWDFILFLFLFLSDFSLILILYLWNLSILYAWFYIFGIFLFFTPVIAWPHCCGFESDGNSFCFFGNVYTSASRSWSNLNRSVLLDFCSCLMPKKKKKKKEKKNSRLLTDDAESQVSSIHTNTCCVGWRNRVGSVRRLLRQK